MTGRPAAFSALAFASTARVADSEMADTRADILVVGIGLWCHPGTAVVALISVVAAAAGRQPSAGSRAAWRGRLESAPRWSPLSRLSEPAVPAASRQQGA